MFEPAQAGALSLANRIVMAPLTRNRAGPSLVPGKFSAEYYAQRATAGLIVAEATQISAQAQGYADTPGCYTDDQVAGWKQVTDAVHAKGGKIVVQLWHTGRVSHTSFQKGGQAPVGPSAMRANTKTFIAGHGFVDASMPRALKLSEIPGIIEDFRYAYTNLETAVRAAREADRDVIFEQYNKQMERLDESTKHQLKALRSSLSLEVPESQIVQDQGISQ
jgi:N-ethylmaleimide reductase